MTSAIDSVYKKFQKIKDVLVLILQHTVMMNIFSQLYRKLPELKEYLNWYRGEKNIIRYTFATKSNHVCVDSSGSLKNYSILRRQQIDRLTHYV